MSGPTPQLNARQREAVLHTDTPLLVLAGAGSGKTRVITHKIAHLIRNRGLDPARIAAVTFTNKAAREMKARVAQLIGEDQPNGLRISTFHTLGLRILQTEHERLGYRKGFSIFDAGDSQSLLKEIMKRDGDDSAVQAAQWKISAWKNALVGPEHALAHAEDALEAGAARLYAEYQRSLKAYNGVDFDDLIGVPVTLFRDEPDVLDAWKARIRYLLADEYQDTNTAQYILLKQLAGKQGRFTVVGDDDQSIYTWRGADPENLRQLSADYPTMKVVKLEQNYRSSNRILTAANTLIDNNPHVFEKALWSAHGPGDRIRIVTARDEHDEVGRVVADLNGRRIRGQGDFGDFAILYRGNHQARLFEQALRTQQIPYHLSGGSSFFERTEVRDIMAYLKLMSNPDDDTAFLRVVNVPRREIGASTLEGLSTAAAQGHTSLFGAIFEPATRAHVPARGLAALERFARILVEAGDQAGRGDPVEAAADLVDTVRYESWIADSSKNERHAEVRVENVTALLDWLKRVADANSHFGLAELLAHMTLMDRLDDAEEAGNQVSLMTLHAAKGLEFRNVYLVGFEEGLLPHHQNLEGPGLEEERRLAYVGITRAQARLIITHAAQRKRFGQHRPCEPSRFLDELPADAIEWESDDTRERTDETQQRGRDALASLRALIADN